MGGEVYEEGVERSCILVWITGRWTIKEVLGGKTITFTLWTCCLKRSWQNYVEVVCVFAVSQRYFDKQKLSVY